MILIKQMMVFLVMMILGYAMARKKILDIKVTKAISWIIVNIANPALIISGSIGNAIEKMELLSVLKVSIVIYITLIVIISAFPFLGQHFKY